MNNNIYMLLGLCGVGKTTLINELKAKTKINAFDFDDIGVPISYAVRKSTIYAK